MAKTYKLQDFNQLKNRAVFFDANILIYLFWATGQHHYEQNYARVFNNLRKQNNVLLLDFLVLSEVINQVMRSEFNKNSSTYSNYKSFRNSIDGKEILNDIYTLIKDTLLKHFQITGKAFDQQNIEHFLAIDTLDFVDKAIVSLCIENNYVLLTNDSDFKDCGLDILTGNPRIIF